MGLAKGEVVIFLLIVVLVIGLDKSDAEVYRVGDSAGWTNVGHVDYRTWSSEKTFHVGDIIMFEYNRQFHNVVRVTHRNFNACNATGAYETFSSGNDSFVVRRTGHFYFICGRPGHCQSGQRVDIRVPVAGNSSPSPSPSPSPTPSPIVPTPPPPPASQPPRIPPPTPTHPSPSNPPSSQPPPPQSPVPSASPPRPFPQPAASPPMNYDAPAPSPTSGSSLIYFSKWLIFMSAFSLLFWMEW